MKKINKIKLSKRTKMQIHDYLRRERNYLIEVVGKYHYYSEEEKDICISFISALMLDIEFFGVI